MRPRTHTTTHGELLPHKWGWQGKSKKKTNKQNKTKKYIANIDLDKNIKCPLTNNFMLN